MQKVELIKHETKALYKWGRKYASKSSKIGTLTRALERLTISFDKTVI